LPHPRPKPWASDGSHLRYVANPTAQLQATVKFHGVFASHWKSLASAPEASIRRVPGRDSGDLVTPFMRAVNQTARHFAHVCCFLRLRLDGVLTAVEAAEPSFNDSPCIAARVGLSLHPDAIDRQLSSETPWDVWHAVSEDSGASLQFALIVSNECVLKVSHRSFLLIVSSQAF
jgi:hypothetical protein